MKISQSGLLGLSVLCMLSGCGDNRLTEPEQGYWVSEPYGSALHVVADAVMYYEFTPDYCVLSNVENLSENAFSDRYQLNDDTLFSFTYPGLAKENKDFGIEYISSDQLPSVCLNNVFDLTSDTDTDSPDVMLEIFLQTYSQYYYSFESAGVDWTDIAQQARGAVSPDTTRDELFKIMSNAIAPLQNGHVFVMDDDKVAVYRQSEKPILYERLRNEFLVNNGLTLPLSANESNALAEYIEDNESLIQGAILGYLNPNTLSYAANNHIIWGKHENLGYIFIDSFNDYVEGNDHSQSLALLNNTMQQIMADFELTDGIVIDLRFNGGGYAYLAKALSEYLISNPQTGYIKRVRYGDQYTSEQVISLTPKSSAYTRPVAVLISNTTASAAELATLMLSTSEQVQLIGEHTQGMLSGSLIKSLPNGFKFGLSNSKLLSSERMSFEQQGIPPVIQTSFFSQQERQSGIDEGLEAAFESLLLE
ncbi:MAG: S41 family peptidase [Alteromonadaceae bacterium]|nr:S41 family peptidase [Alteromonadaceae bacterium]